MQTQGICVELHFSMSLDKHPHGKKSKREQKSQNMAKKVKTRAKKSKRKQKSQNASKKVKARAE